ncbi:MAG: hypothetical protein VX197_02400 [Pseudomonadota bacterium]|mgnify:FL=1|jgi:hypothetical protein|nr:hypothetical protein [Pseudomonadota bacterium]MEC8994880.1 hypothetical protein [Pseudomonadota bacterium]MEC9222955.1 hypothetical protein [Pseudomonadota bacterium]MED5386081.1 hypothetical protein [Pseudomonadota bacterium]MEE3300066.1 hypothetical protein [Pseudomonadota bacterium]|tara:strand:+ start:857 stop:1330 length:474 start_codon:yes stop_codon:yes gene_type:complete
MKRIFFTLAFLLSVQLVWGQEAGESEIEEIIVIGELSRSAVRAQIVRVENDIYRFYNEHNGNQKLDIECREIALTGTRIKQRVCEPVFWTEARARTTREFLQEFNTSADLENLSEEVEQETDEMNQVYVELIQKHASFAEALLILEDLKARLEELGG